MDGSGVILGRRLDAAAVFAPASGHAPHVAAQSQRHPQCTAAGSGLRGWAALAVSAMLHGAAALAVTAAASSGPESSGAAGVATQSLPPSVRVELLTPADLVSDARPEIAPDLPMMDAPSLTDDSPPPSLSPEIAVAAVQPLVMSAAPMLDQGAVVARTVPPAPKDAGRAKKKKPAAAAEAGGNPAKGNGGGEVAGTGGTAKASGLTKGQIADLKAEWGAAVRSKVERKRAYPVAAKGAAGTVKVRITLDPSGKVLAVLIVLSSGNDALDAAAIRAVKATARFPAAPKGLSEGSYSFTLPMKFQP